MLRTTEHAGPFCAVIPKGEAREIWFGFEATRNQKAEASSLVSQMGGGSRF